MEKNKAIVAIARQLLVVIWHVLTERAADQHADPDMVAFKLTLAPRLSLRDSASAGVTWSWKLTQEQRGGLTTRQFVRYQLLRLGLGHDLTHVVRGGGKYLIAPLDEVLRLKPDLQPAASDKRAPELNTSRNTPAAKNDAAAGRWSAVWHRLLPAAP